MANLVIPRREIWTKQPSGSAEIDWSSPIAAGLISAVLPSAKMFAGTSPSSGGFTATNHLATEHGIAIGRNGGAWSLTQRSIYGISATSDMTLLSFMYGDSTVLTESQPVSTGQSAAAISSAICVGDGTTKALRYRIYLGATRYVGGSSAIPAKPTVVIGRQRYGIEQALFVGGEKDPITGSYTGATSGVTHFGSYNGNASTRVLLSAIWARALTDAEIRSISANPWQIFNRHDTRIFVPVSAATSYALDSQSGSIAVAGSSATLKTSRKLSANAGAVSIVGASSTLKRSIKLSASSSAVSVVGAAATCKTSRKLNAAVGSVSITGAPAEFVYTQVGASPVLNAEAGNVTIAGAVATLKASRKLASDAGSIVIAGSAATLVKQTAGRALDAQAGTITIAGAVAGCRRQYKLASLSGSVVIAGASATFAYVGIDGDQQYPLAGLSQSRPLAGMSQTYPLGN